MLKTTLPLLVGLFLTVLFTACGDSNPFIGKWQIDMEASRPRLSKEVQLLPNDINFTVEFTNDSYKITLNGEVVIEDPISYKKNPDNTWVTCSPEGSDCDNIVFLDKNTIRMPTPVGDTIFRRM
ncbi:MAG: phage major tail tube protein [Deltaproteobacteria bacterium]|jgi:hypothetical protein|nr:phage major tail tube protein [Deltaproteobacteria bacterium]